MVVAKSAVVGDGTADKAGDVITYTITAKNDGNIDLTHVAVSDSIEGATADTVSGPASGDSNTDGVLNPGETWTYTATHTLSQSELDTKGGDGDGKLDDTATVTTDQTSGSASASVPLVYGPDWKVEKFVTDVSSANGPGTADFSGEAKVNGVNWDGSFTSIYAVEKAGDVVTYQVVLVNEGNVDISNVSLSDALGQTSPGAFVSLTDAKGETLHPDAAGNPALTDILQVQATWTWTST